MMKWRNSKVSNPFLLLKLVDKMSKLLLKPKPKKVTEDTKKKANDVDKPKTESKTEPKKKPRKQAEPQKKILYVRGNKDLEEGTSANVMPKVERSSISGKVIVRKTVIKDTKDDTTKG